MSLEDVKKLISETETFLDSYRMYGKMVTDALDQLNKLRDLIEKSAISEAYELSCSFCEQVSAYKSFVPELADKLEKIREILKCNC